MAVSDKRRKSVSLDTRVADDVDEDDANFSALVNRWTREYFREGRRPLMDETQRDQLLDTLDEIETREKQNHSAKMDVLDQLRTLVEDNSNRVDPEADEELAAEFDELHAMFTTTTRLKSTGEVVDWERSPRQPDAVAIRTHADRLGITPDRLSRELRKRDREEGFVDSIQTDGGEE